MDDMTQKWFSYETTHPDADMNLFCFPHAGAGPGVYAYWGRILTERFNFYPVHYPLRERRKEEPLPGSIQELADSLAEENSGLFMEKPFAFYGHCMGGILAYETARSLERLYGVKPVLTVVSSSAAPDCPVGQQIDEQMDIGELAKIFADMQYIQKDMAKDDMYVKYFIPVLKADYLLQQKYILKGRKKLGSPITVMFGDSDKQMIRDNLLKWENFSSEDVSFLPVSGGHFFINKENAAGLLETIQQKILEKLEERKQKQ